MNINQTFTSRVRDAAFVLPLSMLFILPLTLNAQHSLSHELDAYWGELSRTVDAGDFEGYKALYHEDAIMVNEISGSTYPIGDAFAGWKQGFDDTKEGMMDAEVTFRFSKRLIDGVTSFETGIFRYVAQPNGEAPSVSLIHFDALCIKKDGQWLMVMERQISRATELEWDALAAE